MGQILSSMFNPLSNMEVITSLPELLPFEVYSSTIIVGFGEHTTPSK